MEEELKDNDQLVLITGYSATGKSASLMNIRNQEKWLYLVTESGKRAPFKNTFKTYKITDPYQVMEAFDYAIDNPDEVDGIIIDSLTFLMDMFESQYVLKSANTMKAWGDYQQFFKELMQRKVPLFSKPTIFIAHVKDEVDEATLVTKTCVPVKGALRGVGIEAFFSCIVSAKRMAIKDLSNMDPELLHISEDDEIQGYKHVFQTRLTKSTLGERIRGPIGMFSANQTFIDNDAQLLMDHLNSFYSPN